MSAQRYTVQYSIINNMAKSTFFKLFAQAFYLKKEDFELSALALLMKNILNKKKNKVKSSTEVS